MEHICLCIQTSHCYSSKLYVNCKEMNEFSSHVKFASITFLSCLDSAANDDDDDGLIETLSGITRKSLVI